MFTCIYVLKINVSKYVQKRLQFKETLGPHALGLLPMSRSGALVTAIDSLPRISRPLVHSERCRSTSESLGTELVSYQHVSKHAAIYVSKELTDEVLARSGITLVVLEVGEEVLEVRLKVVDGAGRYEAVDLHGAVRAVEEFPSATTDVHHAL